MPTEKANYHLYHYRRSSALATYSLLPIIQSFTASSNYIDIDTHDISLYGHIIITDYLNEKQRIGDALAELGN
ncbi:NADP-dependent isocitrate dehydrogenase [Vibrio chagasii]|nr:NADP-dependent isocitrate dehydrogenase [Vibrio chagasii]